MAQEGGQDFFPEPLRGVLPELQLPQDSAIFEMLSVVPGSGRKIVHFVVGIEPFQGRIGRWRAVDIFLVPETMHMQCRYESLRRFEPLIGRHFFPVGPVSREFHQPLPHLVSFIQVGTQARSQGSLGK